MDTQTSNSVQSASAYDGFTPLSLLDLNGIKLDVRHTVLTPAYIEELIKAKATEA